MLLFDKWKPLLAPETEVGADPAVDTGGAPPSETPLNERPVDGPGSGRSEIRKSLEKGFEGARKAEQEATDKDRDTKTGRYRSRARTEMDPVEAPAEGAGEQLDAEAGEPQEQQGEFAVPEGWTKDAKAEWGNLPPTVQAAVAKRETDMAKGVEDLKKSYADMDAVIKPRSELIRRHGHTTAQAVNQLFAWFDALAANPQVAFPALAQSFRFDLRNVPGLAPTAPQQFQQPQQQQEQIKEPTQPAEVPAYIKQLEDRFNQQLGLLTTNFTQAQQAKTQEILDSWSKDKPYFEDVRKVMGNLIASGTVQPLPNGSADLDRAYDMALYAVPEIRAKILEEKAKADEAARKAEADKQRKLQQEAADKARKASASIAGGAPGSPAQPQQGRKKAKSVRESIEDARKEVADGRRA